MWCKHCRQDVPGLATATAGQRACARCGAVLVDQGGPRHVVGVEELAAHGVDLAGRKRAPEKAPLAVDEWEFDHDLRELQGLVAAAKAGQTTFSGTAAAIDPLSRAPVSLPTGVRYASPRSRTPGLRSSRLAWFVLTLGVLAFAAGGVLLALSYAQNRGDLWSLGMPITVAGQVCLLLGLVLQLERVWQGSRYAVDKLGEVDQRLADLSQTTTLLGVTHGSAAQAFYAHMAEGASPHLLLADLKGQLDLLAVRMSQRS